MTTPSNFSNATLIDYMMVSYCKGGGGGGGGTIGFSVVPSSSSREHYVGV